jgi:hypothetical protein
MAIRFRLAGHRDEVPSVSVKLLLRFDFFVDIDPPFEGVGAT